MDKKLQQIEYFVSLLIESDTPIDLSDAEDDRVYEYHQYKRNMELLRIQLS